jgi:hypothetical protein
MAPLLQSHPQAAHTAQVKAQAVPSARSTTVPSLRQRRSQTP